MTNKDKFLALVKGTEVDTMAEVQYRIANRSWLQVATVIACKVLNRLDELQWSQKDLAEKMNFSTQQINKIVRGQENLTLATIVKLEKILGIVLLN